MNNQIDTKNLRIEFGKYKGELWTRLPLGYLKYLINENNTVKEIAFAELKRRGADLDINIEITGHAIDRASEYCLSLWQETRNENEGLHSWLLRQADEAMKKGLEISEAKVWHKKMVFVFSYGYICPVLKTVYLKENSGND